MLDRKEVQEVNKLIIVGMLAAMGAQAEVKPDVHVPGMGEQFGTAGTPVMLLACGVPLAMVEPSEEGSTLWVGVSMLLRIQALALTRPDDIVRQLHMDSVYPGREWNCEQKVDVEKAKEWGA